MVNHEDMSEDDPEEMETPSWDDIIKRKTIEANKLEARNLISLLRSAPSLQDLKFSDNSVILYSGVPETANPRRNKVDQQWWACQHKIEYSMQLLVHYLESNNHDTLGAVAAYLRSAWEEANEARRGYLAGRQAWKLETRHDDRRTRLLTEDEEKKVRPEGKGKGKGKGNLRPWSSSWQEKPATRQDWGHRPWRPRSRSQGKGKGGTQQK